MDTRDKVSAAELKQPGKYSYVIFGEGTKDKVKAVEQYISKDMVVEADSIKGLADKLDINEKALTSTIDGWNKAVSTKKDEDFGRTTGMTTEVSGKYYAIKVAPGIHHTMAGVKINTNTQVLKKMVVQFKDYMLPEKLQVVSMVVTALVVTLLLILLSLDDKLELNLRPMLKQAINIYL